MTLRHAMPMSYFECGTETQAEEEKYFTGMGDKNAIFGDVFSRYIYMQIFCAQHIIIIIIIIIRNNITCRTNCK
jgi:uncharacterized membrane protein